MDPRQTLRSVEKIWDESIIPALTEYIRIPCKSPAFDPDWRQHGHLDRAAALVEGWCRERSIEGMEIKVVRLEGRTPLVFMEIPGEIEDTVMLYGHIDKQPEMSGWSEGLGPWEPVLRDDKLYGRGGADDGYAAFAALAAIEALREQGTPHARCVVLIEACEESGSTDLPHHIEELAHRIGQPSLVIALDSGAGNFDQLWCTTSLRGFIAGDLTVEVLSQGVHSGDASGIVPSSFRILRHLLSRLEHAGTGEVVPAEFHVEIPQERIAQAKASAGVLDGLIWSRFPLVEGVKPVSDDPVQLVLNRTWRPAVSITGARGLPDIDEAGNVLLPTSTVRISVRVPPTTDVERAAEALEELLERDPPCGARVRFQPETSGSGWNAPELEPWLEKALHRASKDFFGEPAVFMGEGGSIPFMNLLGERFPGAQFLITGVLGPASNAHGPDEFLHLPFARKLTACAAHVLGEHARREPPES